MATTKMQWNLLFLCITLSNYLTVLHRPPILRPPSIFLRSASRLNQTLRLQRLHRQFPTAHHYKVDLRLLNCYLLLLPAPYFLEVLQVGELRYPQLSRALHLLLLLLLLGLGDSRGEQLVLGALRCLLQGLDESAHVDVL